MDTITLRVPMPKETFLTLGLSEREAVEAMKKSFIIELYRKDKISSGKAAELLGVRKLDFIRLLAEEGIPFFDYTDEELEEEFRTVRDRNLRRDPPGQGKGLVPTIKPLLDKLRRTPFRMTEELYQKVLHMAGEA